MTKIKLLFFIAIIATSNYACITTPTISYFSSADSTKYQILPENAYTNSVIKPDDILAVTIGSLNQESNEILNFNNTNSLYTTSFPNQTGGQRGQPLGFLVDQNGKIEIPLIGSIAVKGLKLEDAAQKIKIEVIKILKEPSVSVRFLNHKFSVLGEVNRPGVYNLLNDKTTLPEALAMAGDLTVYGNRQNIMFIRDYYGKREQIRIDLRNKEIFSSPYYYLKDGDLIYIEPFKAKATYTEQKVQLAPLYISLATSLVSIVALITNIVK